MSIKLITAEEEYRNNPDLKESDVDILKQWVAKQPHLPTPTELQLIWFLRSCKYSIELAKTSLDNYFTLKTQCADFFDTPCRADMEKALDIGLCCALPKRSSEGFDIFLTHLTDVDPAKFDWVCVMRTVLTSIMLNLYINGSSNGFIMINNMKSYSLGHIMKFNLMAMKKLAYFLTDAAPIALKSIHLINVDPVSMKLMDMARPFTKSVAKMIHVHTGTEGLKDHLPLDCIPKEYGGSGPSVKQIKETLRTILDEANIIMAHADEQKVDESKRPPEEANNVSNIFGMEGCFRKLDLD